MEGKSFFVRCRGIFLHEGKLLVVKHPKADFYCLPGGGLEYGESPLQCMTREIIEELGIPPVIGKLTYVHSWYSDNIQHIEFFFNLENASEYLDTGKLTGTHSHEIGEMVWASKEDDLCILPENFANDFKNGKVNTDKLKFI